MVQSEQHVVGWFCCFTSQVNSYGHCGTGRTACGIQVNGRRRPGKPKIMWKKLTENDCSEWKLMTVNL